MLPNETRSLMDANRPYQPPLVIECSEADSNRFLDGVYHSLQSVRDQYMKQEQVTLAQKCFGQPSRCT